MGRPSTPLIEISRVVEEALAMIDEGGLKSLSMRGLGRRLGVNPASLYHHFHSKDDVIDAVREHIFRKAKMPARMTGKSWSEQLVALSKAFRAGLTNHPNAINLVAAANPARTRAMGHPLYEGVMKALLEAGFTEEQCVYLLVGVEAMTSGLVMQEMSMGKVVNYGVVDGDRFPNLYRVTQARPTNLASNFNRILADFIEGVGERLLAANRASSKSVKAVKSAKAAKSASGGK